MSRVGRNPITLPAGVQVRFEHGVVTVKGPKGELSQPVASDKIEIKIEGNVLTVSRLSEQKEIRAMHGLYRALIANMVTGVTSGFERGLIVNGVGYKVQKQGNKLVMNIGFSHPVEFEAPAGITLDCPSQTEITVKGISKEAVGQTAANIRALKKPEPYHCYGIRYKDEVIQRKEGKTAGK